jgi:hypothetical protein
VLICVSAHICRDVDEAAVPRNLAVQATLWLSVSVRPLAHLGSCISIKPRRREAYDTVAGSLAV